MTRSFTVLAIAIGVALTASACSDPEAAKQRYLANGNEFLAANKVQEAIVEYRNAIRQDPRFGEARRKLAEAYVRSNNPQSAFREYVRAADLLPEDTAVQLAAGHYLLLAARYEDAKARADGVLAREPQNVEALIMRANAMAGLKDVPGAIREIEEALQVEQGDGRIYTSLGVLQSLQGQRDLAEAAFAKAIEISPKSVDARLAMANFSWSSGRLPQAEEMLEQALALDPAHTLANRMLALIYIVTRRAAEAEQPLKAAVRPADPSSRLALADYYMLMRREEAAAPLLKELSAQKDFYGQSMIRLAQIEYFAGRGEAAQQMLNELLAREPRNVRALALKSRWQLRAKDIDGAMTTGVAATEADPVSAEAHLALAHAQMAKGQDEVAIKSFHEVLRLNPRVIAAQVMLSRLQLRAGNAAAAVELAEQAKRQQPQSPEVQYTLARGLLMQGNAERAEPEVRALLAQFPKAPESHAIHGMLLMAKNDREAARAAFERALALQSENIEALEGLLSLDGRSGTLPAAVARIEERLAKHPDHAGLLLVAGRTYLAASQSDKAVQALRRVVDIAPHSMAAYLMLGRIYMAQNRLDDALAQFDAAARRRPDQIGAPTMAAMILELQNKRPEAQRRYEAIVAGNQRASVAANNLAWIYAEHGGNLDLALQLAQSAKSQLPRVPEVNDTLGWVYVKKDLPQLAIPLLEESVSTDPTNVFYRFHLGLAYAKAGLSDKARASLERALQINAQFEGADLARKTLADLKG